MTVFNKISDFWYKQGWLVMLIAVLIFFVLYYFFFAQNNEHGTFSQNETFLIPNDNQNNPNKKSNFTHNNNTPSHSRAPKESKGEKKCRDVLQSIFHKPFPNCRPDFMFNSVTGNNLELDMFNYDLKLAVEYNGQQHYKYTPFMHGNTKDKFYAQQYRDRIKKDACKKLKINLIEVPYTIKENQIEEFLKKELISHGYKF